MKIRYLAMAIIGALALTLGAVACSDDGDALTLEEFFQRIEELDDEFEARTESLEAKFDEAVAEVESADEVIDAAQSFFDEGAAAIETFVEGIADIDPPEEAEELYDEVLEAGQSIVELFGDAFGQIKEATTEEEFEALFENSAIEAAFDRFDAACEDAQAFADDRGISVDFNCGDEEE